MRILTVRLPDELVVEIDAESHARNISKSDVVRERLQTPPGRRRNRPPGVSAIADLIGAVGGLPRDLSSEKKAYLRSMGYGGKRPR